jgi:hypothetical protein
VDKTKNNNSSYNSNSNSNNNNNSNNNCESKRLSFFFHQSFFPWQSIKYNLTPREEWNLDKANGTITKNIFRKYFKFLNSGK